MPELPDPLRRDHDSYSEIVNPLLAHPVRILSDRGIRQAMQMGLIKTTPAFNPLTDTTRIQPATLDVRILEVDELEPIGKQAGWEYPSEKLTLPGRQKATVTLTELIDFGQFARTGDFIHSRMINTSMEARSSARRIGCYAANPGMLLSGPTHSQIEIGNFSLNNIHFAPGERIAQAFFTVDPFADYRWTWMAGPGHKDEALEIGEKVRSLDMGAEADYRYFKALEKAGYMRILPEMKFSRDAILVHASDRAYRLRTIEGGIMFSELKGYSKEDLLEPIDISKGYTVKPYEHIIIETVESFGLSPHVGIRFWDNPLQVFATRNAHKEDRLAVMENFCMNMGLIGLTDGWIDPGYCGGFSRQPKWLTGRTVRPGDVVGYGQVFFFPKGVCNEYGNSNLGSQYNGKKDTQLSG